MNDLKIEFKSDISNWELKSPKAQRDLIIKKIAIAIILMANLAGIATGIYFLTLHFTIPTQALIASPFIVGVLGAIAYLKIPTLGVTKDNYTQYSNPALVIGKILAYLFLGPVTLFAKNTDFYPYHDPYFAERVSQELSKEKFDFVAKKYGPHFDHLVDYGFIPENYRDDLLSIYREYKPVRRGLDFYEKEYGKAKKFPHIKWRGQPGELKDAEDQILNRWNLLKGNFQKYLPHPEQPKKEFSSLFKYKFAQFFRELSLYPYKPNRV